ncbi:MAG TPA: PilX N-terminal domain-containing pilus assembly protein, partial [Terriglobales bacterium]
MQNMNRRSEKGIALVLSILALLLLTAIAAGMMYMSTTERLVNNNFRQEEKSYFAARAGVEEVRDRMLFTTPNSICTN